MKECIRYVPLIGVREGELSREDRAALDAHLAGCAACRAREAEAQALGALVREGLMAKANARDFAPFVDGVMERIHSTRSLSPRRAGGEGEGEGGRLGLFAWLDHHRKAALAALAPVLAAAVVLVYVQTRPGPPQMAAAMELSSQGDVSMVLETSDGPVVLLGEENS